MRLVLKRDLPQYCVRADPLFMRRLLTMLALDRGHERVAVEAKAGRGDDARAVRVLRESLPDVEAARAWIIDQAPGVELVGEGIARAGFAQVIEGVP